MPITTSNLPKIIYLQDYNGDFQQYFKAIYDIFEADFINYKPKFGSHQIGHKRKPIQECMYGLPRMPYTLYHITHADFEKKGEKDRSPDLRRCERVPWARYTIEYTVKNNLSFWEQERNGKKNRICIMLDVQNDYDYFIILEVRENYILLWTTFVAQLSHEKRKKMDEYNNWKKENDNNVYTPDTLVKKIRATLKNQGLP
jgi:hypothetical protein